MRLFALMATLVVLSGFVSPALADGDSSATNEPSTGGPTTTHTDANSTRSGAEA